VDWYNSLISKGVLTWDVAHDLCPQPGVTCDGDTSGTNQRVTQL